MIETSVNAKIDGEDAKVMVMGYVDDFGYVRPLSLFVAKDGAGTGMSINIGKKEATVLALSILELAK